MVPGSAATLSARASGTANTAPMLARTAFGPNGSAVPGPSATDEAPNAWADAQDRADVARVVDAVQVHAQRSGRRHSPPLLVDRERPGSRTQARGVRQQLGLDLDPWQAAAGRAIPLDRLPAGRVGGREQILALGDEAPGELARAAALAELADLLELCVLVAGDRHLAKGTKRAPSLEERRPVGGAGLVGVRQPAASASRARSAKRRKVSASRTAMSASILRSSSTPACWRPCMNCE